MSDRPRILVLGGNGFIGRHIVARLSSLGYPLVIGTRDPQRPPRTISPAGLPQRAVRLEERLQPQDWSELLDGFDLVINAVGILRQRGRETYARVHHEAPAALALACAKASIPLLHVSALGLRHPVRSRFLHSKLRGEQALLGSGARVCIVRPSLLDGDGGYGAAWVRRVGGWPVQCHPGNAQGKIASCSVDELAEAIGVLAHRLLGHDDSLPCIVELGGGTQETIAEHLARRYRAAHGRDPLQLPIPAWAARACAHLFDLLHFSPYSFGHYELLRFDNCPAPNRLPELLGREPSDTLIPTVSAHVMPMPADA